MDRRNSVLHFSSVHKPSVSSSGERGRMQVGDTWHRHRIGGRLPEIYEMGRTTR
jgi:hypothetical protein